jgi:steroid delta-isomerase-like uncharacterized protein
MLKPVDVVTRFWESGNKHDLEAVFALIHPDIESDYFSGPIKGKDFFIRAMTAYAKAFPDSHDEVTSMIAQGEFVACEYLETATFKGPLQSLGGTVPPNNRKYRLRVASFFRVNASGLITEMRNYFDSAIFGEQTGIDLKSLQKR